MPPRLHGVGFTRALRRRGAHPVGAGTTGALHGLATIFSQLEMSVKLMRMAMLAGSVVVLTSVLGGCVVRPLWWGGHGGYERRDEGRSDGRGDRHYRDEDHRTDDRRDSGRR